MLINQEYLLQHVKTIFSGSQTHVNSRKLSNLKYPSTGGYVEFDIWIPDLFICFEFQDPYHYVTSWFYQNPQAKVISDDAFKQEIARKNGLSLITIPCWWDGSAEGLLSTINFQRPDLVDQSSNQISLNPSEGFFQAVKISNVGELMLASFPMSPNFFSEIPKWWVGEKYDGIRCCWNSLLHKLYTRNGNEIVLPQTFYANAIMPKSNSDGELWFGRGQFSHSYALLSYSLNYVQWESLRLICFDEPSIQLQKLPFEKRYTQILFSINHNIPFSMIAPRISSTKEKQVEDFTQNIIHAQGEGVILRAAGSPYVQGRNPYLVKLKSTLTDKEAIVVSVDKNSIDLKLPEGNTFRVPREDVHVPKVKVGDIVSVEYESNFRRIIPAHCRVFRIRSDLVWDDVVRNSGLEKKFLNEQSKKRQETVPSKPSGGNWTPASMRFFLEEIAKKKKLNPLLPETWNIITKDDIRKIQHGHAFLRKCKGGYFRTLQKLFPELKLVPNMRQITWNKIENRRAFFERYAKDTGFDPLIADNWYSQSKERILSVQGAASLIYHHNSDVSKALMDLFPNIGLQKSKFRGAYLEDYIDYRRKIFDQFAEEHGFDPLVAENWYRQSQDTIKGFKGVSTILVNYTSTFKALQDVYPNIGIQKSGFYNRFVWEHESNRRKFFENYAKRNQFDPYNAESWYLQPLDLIEQTRGASGVLGYHNNDIISALVELFPTVGLDAKRFS